MELKPCPFCGGKARLIGHRDIENSVYGYSTRCTGNGCCLDIHTRIYESSNDAIEARNHRAAPTNNPLTLEELKQMDGEPVWTVTIGIDGSGRWELVKETVLRICPYRAVLTMTNMEDGETDYEFDTYGKTWLAYRHKPET